MALEGKIMYGLENIHVAKLTGSAYGVPVAIEGAKSVEAEFAYESTAIYADNRNVFTVNGFAGGEGSLGILSLSADEYNLLFGHEIVGTDGFVVKSTDVAPTVALGFSRRRGDGKHQVYWIYNVKFKPSALAATTMEEGKVEAEPIELEFTIGETADNGIYYSETLTDTSFDAVKTSFVAMDVKTINTKAVNMQIEK